MANKISTVHTYPLNGAVNFTITFEYLARKFVKVTLIGKDRKELVLNQDYRFTTKTQITTSRTWTAADGYTMIEIRRFTSATDRLVDFADGSILRAYDLNISQVQTLHVAEEARDLTADTIGVNNDGHLDARGRRIVNLANAVDDRDAVPLGQLKTMDKNSWQARNEALQFRNEAETFRNKAEGFKNESSTHATNAKQWRDEANEFRNEAEQFKNTSGQYAASAGSYAGNAKDSEDEARRIAASIRAAGLFGYITRQSFEKGFNLTVWNETLLWEEEGEYYRWDGTLPKNVPAGSTPETAGGVGLGAWVSVGDASLRTELASPAGAELISGGSLTEYKKSGTFANGGVAENSKQGFLHSDGFYYVNVKGPFPVTVTTGSSPGSDWVCVGLLNQYPLYSPENFGYVDGDDAVTSFQLAFDNMPYGGVFELVAGSVYTFKSQPVKIKKTGTYRGYGTFHTGPVYSHHAQIINNTNGPVFIIEPYYDIQDAKAYGDQNRIIEGFKVSGDKTIYPQSGFLAGQASQNTNVIQHNHVRNMGYGVCALTSYGMVIQHNVFVSNTAGVTANPATFQPQGPADSGQEGTVLWQTNAIEIVSNYFSGNGKAIDFNCPGNQLTILRNVIEGNGVGIHVSSMVGYSAGGDGTALLSVSINDNYMERNPSAHIIIGRSASGTGTAGSGPINIQCINNQLNNAGIPDDSAAVLIYAATNAEIRNSCRNRTTSQLIYYFGGAQLSGVHVTLNANETHAGYVATGKSNTLEFIDINSVRGSGSLSKLYVNPDHSSVITAGQEIQWYSGLSNHPFSSYSDAITFIREMSSEYLKAGISSVEIACAGNIGSIINPPGFVSNLTLSVISGTPVITGCLLSGVSASISGAFSITNDGYPTSTTPFQVLRSSMTITGCTFNYTGQPSGTYLLYANQASTVNLVNCSASTQLPLASDGSIILMSSSGLTGTQTKIRGGQFFS